MRRLSLAGPCSAALAAACLLVTACAVTPDVSGSLSGYVYSAETYQPLAGVVVECDESYSITESDGYYYLGGIPTGFRTVTGTASGYETYCEVLNVKGSVTHDIYMEKYVGITTLSGVVSHSFYGPIEGALVTVAGRSDSTDESGAYSIARIPQGFQDVSVTCNGYRPITARLGLSESEETFDTELKIYATAEATAAKDATVRQHMIDVNFGDLNTLQLLNNGGFYYYKFYIALDWDLPETADIESATLRLYRVVEDERDFVPELNVSEIARPWGEYEITWRDSLECQVAESVTPTYDGGWLSVDVTDAFSDWVDFGSPVHGLCLDAVTDEYAEEWRFASREYETEDLRPRAIIEYAW